MNSINSPIRCSIIRERIRHLGNGYVEAASMETTLWYRWCEITEKANLNLPDPDIVSF